MGIKHLNFIWQEMNGKSLCLNGIIFLKVRIMLPWSSGKGEDSCQRGGEFQSRPAAETIYHAPLIWIKSMKAKIVEK
jgi:hypothetical protein